MQSKLNAFNVQRFSVHDGPGIRTTVFLKGCPLKCIWCHNPESIPLEPLVMFYKDKCIGCDSCKKVCKALHQSQSILPIFENYPYISDVCAQCTACISACPTEALVMVDKYYDCEELFEIILKDRQFYENSGGGVTFSGGEPLLQYHALLPLLSKLKSEGIHIAIETAGHVAWSVFEAVSKYADLFLFDIKALDPTMHKNATGKDNSLILQNFDRLYNEGQNIIVRIPQIPGFNDAPEQKEEFCAFLKQYPRIWDNQQYEYLPYHNFGESKYEVLNIPYKLVK